MPDQDLDASSFDYAEPGKSVPPNFLVVGIGASAGGVGALSTFFENVTEDAGIVYVVILHLSPDHDSELAAILQRVCKLPVHKVEAATKLYPDNVYVISPSKSLSIEGTTLSVRPLSTVEERRAPVDTFLRSLANAFGSSAACVILSGTGSNGSMGLKRIKENGGVAFVQSPREAEFSEMPRNAIATDLVDAVLSVVDIPDKLLAYKNSSDATNSIPNNIKPEEHQSALREIFTQVRLRTGHDFSNYKRATILRRIDRRMNVNDIVDIREYAELVKGSAEETQALLKDLLISVTNFFRDKQAFAFVENEIIPRVFHGRSAEHKVRIWVAGCATGEEAYSIAMLVAEKVLNIPEAPSVQIFATDIDEDALAHAREGLYSINDAADVSPERLRRFFSKEEAGYRIRREIREMVLFANHNVIKDPPFSKLDFITCRNLLIYLNHTAQLRALETFHFALRPGAYLFLGSSESSDVAGDLFVPVSKETHLYQSRQISGRALPIPELLPSLQYTPKPIADLSQAQEKRMLERISYNELHQQLLEQYAPPSVLVNQDFDVVHLSENVGRYFQMAGGEPSNNLLKLVKPELRLELRGGLYQALQRQGNLELKGLKVRVNEESELVNIHIRPVIHHTDPSRGYVLLIFEKTADSTPALENSMIQPDSVARQLEEELMRSKAQLRGSIEQYEVQAEELRASNEELQAMNEELRSSTEELETSKEELQSINEELTTVNQELKVKIEELSQSNNNFINLINSTDLGTIFLDRSFRVNMFTPAARQIYNLIMNDLGRPLTDISNRLIDVDVLESAEQVLQTLVAIEKEVRTIDDRIYMMRISPYRTAEDRINGVVVTFINITERKKAELRVASSEQNLRLLMDSIAEYAIISCNDEGRIRGWNRGAQTIFGYVPEEAINQSIAMLFTPEDREQGVAEEEVTKVITEGRAEDERWHLRKDGSRFFASGVSTKMVGGRGGFVKIARDMTATKLLEQQKDEFIGIASHELKTPVTSIKVYAEILQEEFEKLGEEPRAEMMRKLNVQLDRLTDLINELLDTTKIAEGALKLNPGAIDINEIINQQVQDLQLIGSKHVFSLSLADLPQVRADRDRMRQVISNLLSNAIKYSQSGRKIIVSSRAENGDAIISVRDQGIGMSKQVQKRVFEKFFRVNSPELANYPGMGLGLYITAGIVQAHGGRIWVESKEGEGSVFSFTIPIMA